MKNFEKYKTAKERAKAFYYWWLNHGEVKPMYIHDAAFGWLELEADEDMAKGGKTLSEREVVG